MTGARASLRCRAAMRPPAVLVVTVAAACVGAVSMVVFALTLRSVTSGYMESDWKRHWLGEIGRAADCAMVITSNGPVCGTNDFEGARAFFNIPFGAAPTGPCLLSGLPPFLVSFATRKLLHCRMSQVPIPSSVMTCLRQVIGGGGNLSHQSLGRSHWMSLLPRLARSVLVCSSCRTGWTTATRPSWGQKTA